MIQETYAENFSRLLRLGKRNICQKKSCKQPESDSLSSCFFSRLVPHTFCLFSFDQPIRSGEHFGGIVRPICFAVFRLITNSNFVGCSTGRSAGFAPLTFRLTPIESLYPLLPTH